MNNNKRHYHSYIQNLGRIINPFKHLSIDYGEIQKTVFVVGCGRSGTTWITRLLNADNRYRYVFEPFHPTNCSYMNGLPNIPYLRPDAINEKYRIICDRVFSGKIHSPWIDRYNRRFISSRRMVKSIRMMMALGWLHQNYPEMPIICIMRNPLSVIASRMAMIKKYPEWAVPEPAIYSLRDVLASDFPTIFKKIENKTKTEFNRQALFWGIQNHVALSQLEAIPHILIKYEDCLNDPAIQFWRARKFLSSVENKNASGKIEHQSEYFNQYAIERRINNLSRQNFMVFEGKRSAESSSDRLQSFSKHEIKFLVEILKEYRLSSFYEPDKEISRG